MSSIQVYKLKGINVYSIFGNALSLYKVLILNGNHLFISQKRSCILSLFKATAIHTDDMLAIKTWWNTIFACEVKLHFKFYQSRSSLRKLLFSDLQAKSKEEWKSAESIYDFSVKDIDGNEVSLEKYRYLKFCFVFNLKTNCTMHDDSSALQFMCIYNYSCLRSVTKFVKF